MSGDTRRRLIDEAAASWDIRLRSHRCTERDREEFSRWLEAELAHRAAYDRLQQSLTTLRAASDHPQLRALREIASVHERRVRTRQRVAVVAGGTVIVVVAFIAGLVSWQQPSTQHASACMPSASADAAVLGCEVLMTTATERRVVTLQDGSSVTLNGATRIEAQWTARARNIRLTAGRALFRVAKDPNRPFVVTAGDRSVTALGTVFDVRLEEDTVQVTLLEGRVAVQGVGRAANTPRLELRPNEQLVALHGEGATVQAVDGKQESAWADGQVYFTDEPLADAIAELNQHSTQQVVIVDPELMRYRVNGMFKVDNQEGFVSALTSYFPIDAHRDNAGRIELRARPPTSEPRD